MASDQPLEIKHEDEVLSISIGVDTLVFALEHGLEPRLGAEGLKVTDRDTFVSEILNALQHEEEDGTTPVHRLLDDTAYRAICDGCEGIES